jgi:hypothetical protein
MRSLERFWLPNRYLGSAGPVGKRLKNQPVDSRTGFPCQAGDLCKTWRNPMARGAAQNGLSTTSSTMAIMSTVGTSFMIR